MYHPCLIQVVHGYRGLSTLFPETAMILPSSLIRAVRGENFSLSFVTPLNHPSSTCTILPSGCRDRQSRVPLDKDLLALVVVVTPCRRDGFAHDNE